jgi:NAD(P)-dependent dehydrogenase (short-subunit alcohol dehydrogenase family)
VNLLVNNAGRFENQRLVLTADPDAARREMEVNYFGVLNMTRAFAPVLGANGGGYIANVLSVADAFPAPFMGGYSPAKAAALFLSSITRCELADQGTEVTALIVGSVDTRMAEHVQGRKEDPGTSRGRAWTRSTAASTWPTPTSWPSTRGPGTPGTRPATSAA